MRNKVIRETLKENKMYLWQLADLLGVSEPTMVRRLRHELPEEEQKRIVELIKSEVEKTNN